MIRKCQQRSPSLHDVRAEVEESRKAWTLAGRESALVLDMRADFNRFNRRMQERVFGWFEW